MRISDWSSDVCSSDLQNGRLLNAITAPNVLIREAVLASCAVPGVFPPVMLMARGEDGARVPYQPDRRWVDGSVTHAIPTRRFERLYGVNHHNVNPANPHAPSFANAPRTQTSPIEALHPATPNPIQAWHKDHKIKRQKHLQGRKAILR